jgi:integrase/recombinase XerD
MTQPRAKLVAGPLEPYVSGFRAELETRGYSRWAVKLRAWLLVSLSSWLAGQGLTSGELTPGRVEQFVEERRFRGYKSWISMRSMVLPVEYLRSVGAVPLPASRIAEDPVEELVTTYRRYLAEERGLAKSTVEQYERIGRLFLSHQLDLRAVELGCLSAADVTTFVGRECPRRSTPSAKYLVAGLRAVLRYLHVAGLTNTSLAAAVPGVAGWSLSSLPRGINPALVKQLLASCDRRRVVGRRDYAILTLLVRVGVRSAEVAALELDDLDWHRGEILIRGKGDRHERLPLPADVGEALVAYLRLPRRCFGGCRRVFLRVIGPWGGLAPTGVGGVVHDACVRAGVPPVGAHRLRHTAATEMLRAGASLPEVGQVLRHRRLETTAIYAKVDRNALRRLAQPWPGGVP